jgi:general secretion pathway protein C
MQTPTYSLWWLRIVTFMVAALAAASAAYWVLKWMAPAPAGPGIAVAFANAAPADPLVVARLLGGGQAAAPVLTGVQAESLASRFKLAGVVADRANRGYALISIDGQPAKPYPVGTRVNEDLVLRSVAPRSADLAASADAPVSLTLELPKLGKP